MSSDVAIGSFQDLWIHPEDEDSTTTAVQERGPGQELPLALALLFTSLWMVIL